MITPACARIGLVGAGAISNAYAEACGYSESAALVAVADVRQDAADAMAESVGCKSYRSYRDMATSESLDGVIVCTPPATHPEICIDLLGEGLHVLCEKPLAVGAVAAARMIKASQAAGRILTMASKFRFVDDVAQARSLVASGIIGEPVLFENSFTAHVDMTNRWNSQQEISGGGVLIDNGTHSVDIMRYFLGPLAQLQVVEGKRIQGLAVEDTVRMFLLSEDGVMGSVDLSWSINKELHLYQHLRFCWNIGRWLERVEVSPDSGSRMDCVWQRIRQGRCLP